jgi:hypothetical protein
MIYLYTKIFIKAKKYSIYFNDYHNNNFYKFITDDLYPYYFILDLKNTYFKGCYKMYLVKYELLYIIYSSNICYLDYETKKLILMQIIFAFFKSGNNKQNIKTFTKKINKYIKINEYHGNLYKILTRTFCTYVLNNTQKYRIYINNKPYKTSNKILLFNLYKLTFPDTYLIKYISYINDINLRLEICDHIWSNERYIWIYLSVYYSNIFN